MNLTLQSVTLCAGHKARQIGPQVNKTLGVFRSQREGRIIFSTIIFITVLLLNSVSANESSSEVDLEIRLEVQGSNILTYGVVVGDISVENTGNKPCVFNRGISIASGNFLFELEQPNGSIVVLEHYSSHDHLTIDYQKIELEPGDQFFYPVCLMKLNKKYLFKEPGEYRIRGVFHGGYNAWKNTRDEKLPTNKRSHLADPGPRKSNWVGISVKDPHGRRRLYTDSHPWPNVFMAFGVYQNVEKIWSQMGGYYEYNQEQNKLLVYQRAFSFLGFRTFEYKDKEVPLTEAKEVLALAKECGVGIQMWEWIIQNLGALHKGESLKDNWKIRNGYIFR